MLAIVFRGRNTDNIIADAKREGIITDDHQIVIVCRQDDTLAQDGDVTSLDSIPDDTTIIANGGTTAQLVPILLDVTQFAHRYRIVDVQRDGIVILAQGTGSRLCYCGCGSIGTPVASEQCARNVCY